MENKFEVDINIVMEMYKRRVAELEHENILLNAKLFQNQLDNSFEQEENKVEK